uniref:Solute carrier family 51 member A n=1 Tax=Equus caballus TaxID=9796 RepID=A0A9L0T0A2_HORSE
MESGRTQIKLDPRYTADLLEILKTNYSIPSACFSIPPTATQLLRGRSALSQHLLPILLFLLRKTGPELTSMPISLYFICGTPATAWLDERCHVRTRDPNMANPGPPKRNVRT